MCPLHTHTLLVVYPGSTGCQASPSQCTSTNAWSMDATSHFATRASSNNTSTATTESVPTSATISMRKGSNAEKSSKGLANWKGIRSHTATSVTFRARIARRPSKQNKNSTDTGSHNIRRPATPRGPKPPRSVPTQTADTR
jgi:hypothetical protein